MHFFIRKIYKHVSSLTWPTLIILIILPHYLGSYGLLTLAGEQFESFNTYTYYWMTTITTVGYGDISPKTEVGKLISWLFILPGGVAIFGILLTKILESFKIYWRKRSEGSMDYSNKYNHTVVIGWHGKKTLRMIDLLFADGEENILLCTSKDINNPLPDKILFVKGDSLTEENLLKRAGILNADKIIILGEDDDQTLTAGLSVSRLIKNNNCNVVAYFEKETSAELLRSHCDKAECIVSNSIEMLVRCAQDSGSSLVIKQMLSSLEGPTQYRIRVQHNTKEYGELLEEFKTKYNATLLGVYNFEIKELILNAPYEHLVKPEDTLFYLANERINPLCNPL